MTVPESTPNPSGVQSPAENESHEAIRTEIATKAWRSWASRNGEPPSWEAAPPEFWPGSTSPSVWYHSADAALELFDVLDANWKRSREVYHGGWLKELRRRKVAESDRDEARRELATTREKLHHLELIMGEVRELAELDGTPTDELVVHTLQERLADASTKLLALEHPERPPWTPVRPEDPWAGKPAKDAAYAAVMEKVHAAGLPAEVNATIWRCVQLALDTHEASRGTATQPTPEEPTYFLAADVRNRFLQHVKGALDIDTGIRKAWDRFEKVLTAFPANSQLLQTSPTLGVEEASAPSPEEKQATVWGDDDEVFCPRCAAGVDSSEHHTKCVVTGHAFDGEAAQDPRRPAGGTGDPQ